MKLHTLFVAVFLLASVHAVSASCTDLLFKCRKFNDEPSWGEILWNGSHCRSYKKGRLLEIERLLKQKVSPNNFYIDGNVDRRKPQTYSSAFHAALRKNSPELVALLLKHGGDQNTPVREVVPGKGFVLQDTPFKPLRIVVEKMRIIQKNERRLNSDEKAEATENCLNIYEQLVKKGAYPFYYENTYMRGVQKAAKKSK